MLKSAIKIGVLLHKEELKSIKGGVASMDCGNGLGKYVCAGPTYGTQEFCASSRADAFIQASIDIITNDCETEKIVCVEELFI